MIKLKPCPFCGWNGVKISERVIDRNGYNPFSKTTKSKIRLQVICNKCYSRGKPFTTEWLTNYGNYWALPYLEQKKMIRPWEEKAIVAWNRRAE